MYHAKVGHKLSNYGDNRFDVDEMAAKFDNCQPAACQCRRMLSQLPWDPNHYARFIDPYTQHVRTADPQILTTLGYPSIAQLVGGGRSDRMLLDPKQMSHALHDMWDGWCEALQIHLQHHSPIMEGLCTDERRVVTSRMLQIAHSGKGVIKPYMKKYERLYKVGMQGMTAGHLSTAMRRLHAVYTFAVLDKAAANFTIECQLVYRKMVLIRLSSPEMELMATNQQQLEGLLTTAREAMSKLLPPDKVPPRDGWATYWLSFKMLKLLDPEKTDEQKSSIDMYRCISNTVHSTIEPCAVVLAIIDSELYRLYYEVCLTRAKEIWDSGRCPADWLTPMIRLCFIMDDTAELIKNGRMFKIDSLWKADMKKFFETLKQMDKDGSKINIVSAALHMWDEVTTKGPKPFRCVHVNVEKRTARFIIHRHKQPFVAKSNLVCITRETYRQLHYAVFEHTYVRFGNRAYRQKVGSPMGVASSPGHYRNFLCYLDRHNIETLLASNQMAAAARWRLFFRAVDDMHWMNNRLATEDMAAWGQIGSESVWDQLSYDVETVEHDHEQVGIHTHMCDLSIRLNRATGRFTHVKYNKTMHLGDLSSMIIRYPSFRSQIPMWMKQSVVVGQLSRIYPKSGDELSFVMDSLRLLLRIEMNGIPVSVIIRAVNGWRPRQTVHLAWQARSSTVDWLLRAFRRHACTFTVHPESSQIRQGVANPALDRYISKLINDSA